MTHTCLNEPWIVHPRIVASVIYFLQFAQECKMYCMLKTPPYFHFSMCQKKCRLSLPVVLFIDSVTNRCISNTLSTFNWQHFLSTEFLRLNDFLFVCLNDFNNTLLYHSEGEETKSQEHQHPCPILLEFHHSSPHFCKNRRKT